MEDTMKSRILVIEDEASLARFLQLELNHEEYQAETAQSGYEALGRISEEKWDLVLLDIMMPGWMVLRFAAGSGSTGIYPSLCLQPGMPRWIKWTAWMPERMIT